ncbi:MULTISPECIES: Ger(x)C family spore germination C-terminal domain-containing protein [unclassified Paenibacillus]|uniref:Ger(x)C family spore germination C-terminal domain-containing protein n=1 Tax=unclassified Paenibacillus TaxID=185978 RepID=UPI00240496E0|nr:MULTISPECIES: Ger(x)C family spore germination C-terminal domain-containing protein [unclassified Paenibacillus]
MWNEQESKGKASTLFDDNNTDEAVDHSRLIRHKLEERITLELKKAIEHTQEARADVLQLGMLLEWNHPREWKKLKEHWSDYYADQAEIIVTSDIRIVDFGASK